MRVTLFQTVNYSGAQLIKSVHTAADKFSYAVFDEPDYLFPQCSDIYIITIPVVNECCCG